MIKLLKKVQDEKASVILEFALVLPIMLLLLFGMIEISNYTYASQKNQSAAIIAANLVGNLDNLETEVIDEIGEAVERATEGMIRTGQFGLVVTILQNSGTGNSPPGGAVPFVVHQQSYGNTALISSKFSYSRGAVGSPVDEVYVNRNEVSPALIYNHTFVDREQIVIVEASAIYTPILTNDFVNDIFTSFQTNFETSAANVRIGRFGFLPDETVIQ